MDSNAQNDLFKSTPPSFEFLSGLCSPKEQGWPYLSRQNHFSTSSSEQSFQATLILSKDKAQVGTCQKDSCSFSPAFVPREGTEQSGRCKRYLLSLFLRLSSATRADFRYVRILQPLPCRTNTYWEWHFRYRDMGVSFPMWGSGFIVRECLGPLCDLPIQHGASSALTLGQGDRGG